MIKANLPWNRFGASVPQVCQVQDDFDVAAREEVIATLLWFGPQLLMIVNTAIKNQRQAEFRHDHRL